MAGRSMPIDAPNAALPGAPRSATVTALPGRGEKDAALMRRVRDAGDRAAFAELARHYGPRLKSWLVKRGEGGPSAEDIVQDVLVAAWRKADMFDPAKASFSTWVFRLTRNRWIDQKRKLGRLKPTAPDVMAVLADEPVESAHAALERTAASEAVRAELALLPPEHQRMLHLAFFEGLSHSEIADRTGVPLGTVKSRIRAPLRRLRETLQDYEGLDR